MSKQLAVLLILSIISLFTTSCHAFMPLPPSRSYHSYNGGAAGEGADSSSQQSKRAALMKRQVIPQLIFAGACAGAVFGYVFTHIDEIKAKQKVAVEATMKQQASDLRSTQKAQKEAIDAALKKQDEAIRKINEEAKRRVEDAARGR